LIVDAHQHLWDPGRRDYPWMTGERAPLRRRRGWEDLRDVATPAGVEATVAVQAAAEEEETLELLAAASASGGLIAGVVGWVDLTAPDVEERVAALRAAPGGERLAGIRHPAEDEPDPDWLARDDVLAGLRALAPTELAYDLLLKPANLPAALRVAEAVPDLALVLDHGAKPPIASGGWEPWSAQLATLAAHERVHCKLSGLVTEAPWEAWREAGVERYAERLLELFGPERLMFGSDWPVCTLAASYAEVLALARTALEGLSQSERSAVLGGTAARFYRLELG
jgi:L-fuconolactonase